MSLWDWIWFLLHNSAHLSASYTSFSQSLVLPISIPTLVLHSMNALIDLGAIITLLTLPYFPPIWEFSVLLILLSFCSSWMDPQLNLGKSHMNWLLLLWWTPLAQNPSGSWSLTFTHPLQLSWAFSGSKTIIYRLTGLCSRSRKVSSHFQTHVFIHLTSLLSHFQQPQVDPGLNPCLLHFPCPLLQFWVFYENQKVWNCLAYLWNHVFIQILLSLFLILPLLL